MQPTFKPQTQKHIHTTHFNNRDLDSQHILLDDSNHHMLIAFTRTTHSQHALVQQKLPKHDLHSHNHIHTITHKEYTSTHCN